MSLINGPNSILIEVFTKSTVTLCFYSLLPEKRTTTSPFLFLSVDLPPPPLFQDSVEKNIIPQVNLASVLAKYDGKTTQVRYLISVFTAY